ncbi:hypothetical protein OROGR_016454 [Orobanche gracilis]
MTEREKSEEKKIADDKEEEEEEEDLFDDFIIYVEQEELPRFPTRPSLELIQKRKEFDDWVRSIAIHRKSNGVRPNPWIPDREFSEISLGYAVVSFERRFAEIALEFYEHKMHEKFQVGQVLFSTRAILAVPGFGLDSLWCHVSFTATPKDTESVDDTQKHFFGEMVFDPAKDKYDVIFCSIFKPSDPGLHGCVFCPSHELFLHPAHGCPADGRGKIDKFTGRNTNGCLPRTDCSMLQASPRKVPPFNEWCRGTKEVFRKAQVDKSSICEEFFEDLRGEDALHSFIGVEFEIVELLYTRNKVVVFRAESVPEEWCHMCFTAKPVKVDSGCVSPDYFLSELLHDDTTNKYKAMYCNIFKPTHDNTWKRANIILVLICVHWEEAMVVVKSVRLV